MITSFDLNTILYRILNVSSINDIITGGVYIDERPEDSDNEDITINTLPVSIETCPQTATSNVNIHVPNKNGKIKGKVQKIKDNPRLKKITSLVLKELQSASLVGMKIIPVMMSTVEESSICQHYTNIRIDWNIQIN
jgi:hypothetical protein